MGLLDVPAYSRAQADAKFATVIGPSNGTDDTAWINALLATPGYYRGQPGQTYKVTQLAQGSGVTLDMRGCTIQRLDVGNSMWVTNNQTPIIDLAVATIAAGSNDVVLSSDTAYAGILVGHWVRISGGGGSSAPLVAKVTNKIASGRHLTLDRNAKASVTNQTIKNYPEVTNVYVLGGKWGSKTDALTGSTSNQHTFRPRFVDHGGIQIEGVYSSLAAGGQYALSIGAVKNFTASVDDIYYGRDGIHITGPAENVTIPHIVGQTGDDAVSITATDYLGGLSDVAGDVTGVRVGRINAITGRSAFKAIAGINCTVDKVKVDVIDGISPAWHGVWIGEDALNVGTTGGTFGDLDLGTINVTTGTPGTYGDLYLSSPAGRSVKGRIVRTGGSSADYIVRTGGTSTAVLDRLELDLNVDGPKKVMTATIAAMTISQLVFTGRYAQISDTAPAVSLTAGSYPDVRDRIKGTLTAPRFVTGSAAALTQPALIVPPATLLNASAAVWPAANRAVFNRFQVTERTVLRYLNWIVTTASGNIQVGLVRLTGSGHQTATLIASTGLIACPTAGDQHTDIGAQLLDPGDYAIFLWADNTTFQTRVASASGITALRIAAIVSGLTLGVTGTHTVSWNQAYFGCSAEADI